MIYFKIVGQSCGSWSPMMSIMIQKVRPEEKKYWYTSSMGISSCGEVTRIMTSYYN